MSKHFSHETGVLVAAELIRLMAEGELEHCGHDKLGQHIREVIPNASEVSSGYVWSRAMELEGGRLYFKVYEPKSESEKTVIVPLAVLAQIDHALGVMQNSLASHQRMIVGLKSELIGTRRDVIEINRRLSQAKKNNKPYFNGDLPGGTNGTGDEATGDGVDNPVLTRQHGDSLQT